MAPLSTILLVLAVVLAINGQPLLLALLPILGAMANQGLFNWAQRSSSE